MPIPPVDVTSNENVPIEERANEREITGNDDCGLNENVQIEEQVIEQGITTTEGSGQSIFEIVSVPCEPSQSEREAETSATVIQQETDELIVAGNNDSSPSQFAHGSDEDTENHAVPNEGESDVGEVENVVSDITNDEIKPLFDEIHVDEEDEQEFNHLFDAETVQQTMDDNAREIIVTVGDMEITYVSIEHFKPMQNKDGFEIKANDLLSNNTPFKRNVALI